MCPGHWALLSWSAMDHITAVTLVMCCCHVVVDVMGVRGGGEMVAGRGQTMPNTVA